MTPERILELRIERRILNTQRQRLARRIAELDEIIAAFAPRERSL
jgi:hypothetical protein